MTIELQEEQKERVNALDLKKHSRVVFVSSLPGHSSLWCHWEKKKDEEEETQTRDEDEETKEAEYVLFFSFVRVIAFSFPLSFPLSLPLSLPPSVSSFE